MANVDYIEVAGPTSLEELMARIGTPKGDYPNVVELSADTAAIAQFDEGDEYPYLISVDSVKDVEGRRVETMALYRTLADSTPWALRRSSDDDDIEQVRPALRESA